MARTPSGPAAAFALRSEQASSMFFGPNTMSSRASLSSGSLELKNFSGSLTVHSFLGVEKTLSYCFLRHSAVKAGEGFDFPVVGSRKGPTLAWILALDLQKEKNA